GIYQTECLKQHPNRTVTLDLPTHYFLGGHRQLERGCHGGRHSSSVMRGTSMEFTTQPGRPRALSSATSRRSAPLGRALLTRSISRSLMTTRESNSASFWANAG